MTRRRVAFGCLCVLLAGCAPRLTAPARPAPPPSAIIAALARRETATRGLRLSMSVRLSGTEQGSVLSSPAYLAIDDDGGIRLQVLSPFGMTVLDLAIRGDAYTVDLPLRHQTSTGTVDPRALEDASVPVSDRMIVALALMFRPKARPDTCAGTAPSTIACVVAPDLTARVTVDHRLRPTREEYVRGDGGVLLVATFDDYRGDDPSTLPQTLVIEDPASGARMTIRVQRARTAGERRA